MFSTTDLKSAWPFNNMESAWVLHQGVNMHANVWHIQLQSSSRNPRQNLRQIFVQFVSQKNLLCQHTPVVYQLLNAITFNYSFFFFFLKRFAPSLDLGIEEISLGHSCIFHSPYILQEYST